VVIAPGDSWKLSWRFDAEPFRHGVATLAVGSNTSTFPKSVFTGLRLPAGSHAASIQVTDAAVVASNIITVSSTFAPEASSRVE
jgi:hypothetical protein